MLSFAEKPVLTGDLVTLRPVQPADAAGLLAMDDETARLTGSLGGEDPAWTLEYLEQWYASRAQHDDRIDLSVIERATGAWAGEVVLNDLDPATSRAASGSPSRVRASTAAASAPKRPGSSSTTRSTWRACTASSSRSTPSTRARHVYAKAGFVHEGTKRDALRWNGTWVDCHLMAILPTDRNHLT
jgi:RimJ/RimL family protein N-acetyltransferase